jgi:hypothetical protein
LDHVSFSAPARAGAIPVPAWACFEPGHHNPENCPVYPDDAEAWCACCCYGVAPAATPAPPAFNAAADATLSRAQAVHTQRGGEYSDSWAIDNMVTTFLDATLRDLGVAAWKLDTVEDGINYRAAFATWREEYREETGV